MKKAMIQQTVIILFLASLLILSTNISQVESQTVGVKVGDWVKYIVTGNYPELTDIDWIKIEVTRVVGTTVTVRITGRMSNGTEPAPQDVDFVVGSSQGGIAGVGFIIPANLGVGDTVYFSGTNMAITQETTRTYGGASRTVVGMSVSVGTVAATMFWDKATGMLLEASANYVGQSFSIVASSTSTGGGEPLGISWWIWIVIVVVIVAVVVIAILIVRRRRRLVPVVSPQPEVIPPPPSP